MEEEFVPHKESLELKELGFDWPCFAYFNGKTVTRTADNGTLSIDKINTWRNTFLSYNGGKSCIPNEDDFKQDLIDNPEKYSRHKWGMTISAPLYQQVFKWFGKKHNLHVNKTGNSYYTCFSMIEPNMVILSFKRYNDTKNHYEEAELECLRKLIEMVKQKIKK